jgi:hypothetical protein
MCASERKRGGTSKYVPQFIEGCVGSVHSLSGSGRDTCQCLGVVGTSLFWGKNIILEHAP